MEAAITTLAKQRAPALMSRRPVDAVEELVFDAVAGLPNTPAVAQIMHWTDLCRADVERARDALLRRGVIERAGLVPFYGGARMTFRVAGAP